MQESLVSFEVAKLAKEKGFTKTSNWMGFVDKFYHPRTGSLLSMGRTGRTPFDTLIYCPTQSLLQKWLREVHNIHVIPDLPWVENGWEVKGYSLIDGSKKFSIVKYKSLKTYEDALEYGLLAALKLIKI